MKEKETERVIDRQRETKSVREIEKQIVIEREFKRHRERYKGRDRQME